MCRRMWCQLGGAALVAFALVSSTAQAQTYSLGPQTDLLDSAYYAGGGRAAFWGSLNNAGTTVAFFGVDYTSGFTTEMYLVDMGNPSSWRKLTTGYPSIPNMVVAWTPDDSGFFTGPGLVNAATGVLTYPNHFGYELNDTTTTALPTNNWALIHAPIVSLPAGNAELDYVRLLQPTTASEFDSDGDAEGWTPINGLSAFTVSGGTLQCAITADDPYMRLDMSSSPFAASSSSTVTLRLNLPVRGTCQFLWTTQADPVEGGSKYQNFDSGPAGQFNDIAIDLSANAAWTGTITSIRIDFPHPVVRNLVALPILNNGASDTGRSPVLVTNFSPGTLTGNVDWPYVAPDASAVAFADYRSSSNPPAGDHGDVYNVMGLPDILSGATQAPASLADPRVIAIRTSESGNFAETPSLSQDGSLVLYQEDFNNLFRNNDFFNTLAAADVDIMVSNSNGSGSDYQIVAPLNQAVPTPTRGGTRLTYIASVGSPLAVHLYMTTLEVSVPIAGNTVGNPADNVVETAVPQQANDAAGTVVEIPASTTIDFPDGGPQEIQIQTPIDPVTPAQLPPSAPVDAIPVVRDFGPDGTTFSPPITVTINYTDQEIAGLDEANLVLYRFNELSGIFDIPVTVVARDLVNNTITFETDHFSVFGIGGKAPADTDGDGLYDDDEINVYNTDPDDPDSDGDGMTDGWEVQHTLSPLDDGTIDPENGPNGDPDNDGYINIIEFNSGSNPQDSNSIPMPLDGVRYVALLAGALLLTGCIGIRRMRHRRRAAEASPRG